jgi:hypothetical protein
VYFTYLWMVVFVLFKTVGSNLPPADVEKEGDVKNVKE